MYPIQINFEDRRVGDTGNRCLLSVDGVHINIPKQHQIEKWLKRFFSHKTKDAALAYEVALCIKTGSICWLNGPFPAGEYSDITMFRAGLMTELDENETCEADDGYIHEHPKYIKCPRGLFNDPDREAMQQRVRSRQESVNRRFKQFKILGGIRFRHDLSSHGHVFRAVAVLIQVAIDNWERLWDVDYD